MNIPSAGDEVITCFDCKCHEFISVATEFNGRWYCEACALKEPDTKEQERSDG